MIKGTKFVTNLPVNYGIDAVAVIKPSCVRDIREPSQTQPIHFTFSKRHGEVDLHCVHKSVAYLFGYSVTER